MFNILIVDDEPFMRYAISSLKDWKNIGFDLSFSAKNGEEALEVLAETHVDLVLCDIKMPVMDGLTLLSCVQELSHSPPFVMLTVHSDYASVRNAFKLGAKDYIVKTEIDGDVLQKIFMSILCPPFEDNIKQNYSFAVKNAISYINENYSSELSLKKISDLCELSESYISKLFSKELGMSFIDYLTNVRIHNAEKLLKSTNMKIYQIARHVGFNSTEHFCRVFKKVTSKSPNYFKNKE